jgi:hypothetical protein
LDQVFYNPAVVACEGLGELSVPVGAMVTGLAVWSNGQRLPGSAMPTAVTRAGYQACIAAAGQRPVATDGFPQAYRLQVFPVPAQGTCRIEVDYVEVLPWQHGALQYRLPLTTPDRDRLELGLLQVEVAADGMGAATAVVGAPFRALATVERPTADSLRVAYADEDVLSEDDWEIRWTWPAAPAEPWIASLAPQGTEAGYYAVWVTAPVVPADTARARGLTLAVDASSSMITAHWSAVQQAAASLLSSLRPDDAFGLVVFGNQAWTWPASPARAQAANRDAALSFLRQQSSLGATNYSAALRSACGLAYPDHVTNQVILLTDGAPTLGETAADGLAGQARNAAPGPFTVSAVGIGDRVDRALLTGLSRRLGGLAATVPIDANLTTRLASMLLEVAYTALVTAHMEIDGGQAFDVVTTPEGPIAAGQELMQVGRYRMGGLRALTVTSRLPNDQATARYAMDLATTSDSAVVPGPQLLFDDDFVDTRGGWQQLPGTEGTWTLDRAAGVYRVAVDGYSWVWARVPATSYTIEARVCPGSWATTVVYADADENVSARIDLMAQLGGISGLRLVCPGHGIVTVTEFPVTIGQWYILQVEVGDGAVTASIDGRQVLDHVPIPAVDPDGAIGISSYGPHHETAFDYVRVYAGVGRPRPRPAQSPLTALWARQQWMALTTASDTSASTSALGTAYGLVTPQTALLARTSGAAAWLWASPAGGPATAVLSPMATVEPGLPGNGPRLAPCAPNPFNAATTLHVWLPSDPPARELHLTVYSMLGQPVRTWRMASASPGDHVFVWDGRDQAGREAASGVYVAVLRLGAFRAARTLALVR